MSELKVHASKCDIEPMVQPEDSRQAFSSRLKKALTLAKIHEWGAGARLAKISGKTPKAASKWLNAESMPGRDSMAVIAKALGVRTEWLQYGVGSIQDGEPGLNVNDNEALLAECKAPAVQDNLDGKRQGELFLAIAVIATYASTGGLTPEQVSTLMDLRNQLVHGSDHRAEQSLPRNLSGILQAAFRVAESDGNPDDLISMLEHGLIKASPKEEGESDVRPKKANTKSN